MRTQPSICNRQQGTGAAKRTSQNAVAPEKRSGPNIVPSPPDASTGIVERRFSVIGAENADSRCPTGYTPRWRAVSLIQAARLDWGREG
jgi:hypothetical protein